MLIIIIITIKILCDKAKKLLYLTERKVHLKNIPTKPKAERWNLKVYRKGPWGKKKA